MSRTRLPLSVIFLLAVFLPGCGVFDFAGQGFVLRHDVEADALEVEITYRGVQALAVSDRAREDAGTFAATVAANNRRAAKALAGMLKGERTIVLLYPMLTYELDRRDPEQEPEGSPDDHEESAGKWSDRISVLECRVAHDEAGRLSVYQKLRFEDISRGVDLLNESWCLDILKWSRSENFEVGLPWLDERSRDALVARAAHGVGPLALNRGEIVLTFPLTSLSVARLMAFATEQLRADTDELMPLLSFFTASLSDIRIEEDELVLRFAPDESGTLHFDWPGVVRDYDPSLDEYLREQGFDFSSVYMAEK